MHSDSKKRRSFFALLFTAGDVSVRGSMMKRLNGWQRLWIVLSALYAILVVLFTANSIAESEHYSDSTRASYALKAFADHPQNKQIETLPLEKRRELAIDSSRARLRLAGEHQEDRQTDEEFVRSLSEKWRGSIDFSGIEAENQKMMEQFSLVRVKAIGYGFLAWATPVALLYILGLSVGWIARGFRGGRP